MKKKREKSSPPECVKFMVQRNIYPTTDPIILELIERLKTVDNFNEQRIWVNKLEPHLQKGDHKRLVCKLVTNLYLMVSQKLPIKKTIVRILLTIDKDTVRQCVEELFGQIIIGLDPTSHRNFGDQNRFFCYVINCIESDVTLKCAIHAVRAKAIEIFNAVFACLLTFETRLRRFRAEEDKHITDYIRNATKVLVFVVHKCNVKAQVVENCRAFISTVFKCMIDRRATFDSQKNCGLLIALAFTELPENLTRNFCFRESPFNSLELLAYRFENEGDCAFRLTPYKHENLLQFGVTNFVTNDSVSLAIYLGILDAIPPNRLQTPMGFISVNYVSGMLVRGCLVGIFNEYANRLSDNLPELTETVRGVEKITTVMRMHLPDDIDPPCHTITLQQILEFVWNHLNHHIPAVRSGTQRILDNLILFVLKYEEQDSEDAEVVVGEILKLPHNLDIFGQAVLAYRRRTSKYLPADFSVRLLEYMADPAVRNNIQSLYLSLMEMDREAFANPNAPDAESWVRLYVEEVLPYLKREGDADTVGCYRKLVVKGFELCPFEVVRFVRGYEIKSVSAEFLVLLECMKNARKKGLELPYENPEPDDYPGVAKYYRNLVKTSTLDAGLCHLDEEVRLLAIKVILSPQKHTELFNDYELENLVHFLYYNLNIQTLHVRKEITQLYKTMFIRVLDIIKQYANTIEKFVDQKENVMNAAVNKRWTRKLRGADGPDEPYLENVKWNFVANNKAIKVEETPSDAQPLDLEDVFTWHNQIKLFNVPRVNRNPKLFVLSSLTEGVSKYELIGVEDCAHDLAIEDVEEYVDANIIPEMCGGPPRKRRKRGGRVPRPKLSSTEEFVAKLLKSTKMEKKRQQQLLRKPPGTVQPGPSKPKMKPKQQEQPVLEPPPAPPALTHELLQIEFRMHADVIDAIDKKAVHVQFLKRMFRICLLSGLVKDAMYERRVACLELLLCLADHMEQDEFMVMWHEKDVEDLIDVVENDTYESNKVLAIRLLRKFAVEKIGFKVAKERQTIYDLGFLSPNMSPDIALGAVYMLELHLMSPFVGGAVRNLLNRRHCTGTALVDMIKWLEEILRGQCDYHLNRENFVPTNEHGMFGTVLAIRHILIKHDLQPHLELLQPFMAELIPLCFKIYEICTPIVCGTAPEGHLAGSEDSHSVTLAAKKAQEALTVSWRNVKEISLLFGLLAALMTPEQNPLLSEEQLVECGEFFVKLFLNAKHKGVYEQAIVGFEKLCASFWRSRNATLKGLPERWLRRVLDLLAGDVTDMDEAQLCATRRSAGLPFLVLGIIRTEPDEHSNEHFNLCVATLLSVARLTDADYDEKRNHCMNVLRMIYRDNVLGEIVAPYVTEGVVIAINGFKSGNFAVRNSGTLLYGALVTRIFGVQRSRSDVLSKANRMTARNFFIHYPDLHRFFLDELKTGTESGVSATLYPILHILSRLYMSEVGGNEKLLQFLPYVNKCLANPSYHIRDIAAQASVPLISSRKIKKIVTTIVVKLSNVMLTNHELQGLLLQLKYVLKSTTLTNTIVQVHRIIERTFWILYCTNKEISPYTAGLYLELLVELISTFREHCETSPVFTALTEILQYQRMHAVRDTKHNMFRHLLNLSHTWLYVMGTVRENKYLFPSNVACAIATYLLIEHPLINTFFFNVINYMNMKRSPPRMHSLYETQELRYSERESAIVRDWEPTFLRAVLTHLHRPIYRPILTRWGDFANSPDCRVQFFVMLNYYPCAVLTRLSTGEHQRRRHLRQHIFRSLVIYCERHSDAVSAVIGCISAVIRWFEDEGCRLRKLRYLRFLRVLCYAAAPTSPVHQRLAVSYFLAENQKFVRGQECVIKRVHRPSLLGVVMLLFEDEDQRVRNCISRLGETSAWRRKELAPLMPALARQRMLTTICNLVHIPYSGRFLMQWTLRHKPDFGSNVSKDVFEKGFVNLYSETTTVALETSRVMASDLWGIAGVNLERKTIYIQEYALMITTLLQDFMYKRPKNMASLTHLMVQDMLSKTIEFLERREIHKPKFHADFKAHLNEVVFSSNIKSVNAVDFHNTKVMYLEIFRKAMGIHL